MGRANLRGASLGEADLSGTDLSGVKTPTQEQINKAQGDESTYLPDNIERPESWSKNTDEQTGGE